MKNTINLKPATDIFYLLLLTFALGTQCAIAQIPTDRDGLLAAEGMGQASYAEMNGYPGPKHVLDLAKDLQLTDAQKKSVQEVYNEMKTRATDLANRIIRVEEELNEAFKSGMVAETSVRDDAEQIGKLRGRLRSIHLIAHLKTKKILTPQQIEQYKKLRAASNTPKSAGGDHKH